MNRHRYHPSYRPAVCVALVTLVATNYGAAQRPAAVAQVDTARVDTVAETIRQNHMVHVSPHLLVFDPSTKSATVEFSNIGDTPTEADVAIQLGYPYWQNEDTTLLPPRGKNERAHDTVIFNPGPAAHYAGRWLSGVPTHIVLQPHETRHLTLQIDPPSNLPPGEYYARIVTLVGAHKKRAPVSQDTKTPYMFPIQAWDLPLIRDSVRVFYRQGIPSMGLKLLKAEAKLDTLNDVPVEDVGRHPLRILLQVHLIGTAHFEGNISMAYVDKNGDIIPLTAKEGAAFAMYRDGVMRWTAETDHLAPGHYHVLIRFVAETGEFPVGQQLSMQPVEVELPFDIPND